MNCKCRCKNGSDVLDFLTSVPGGTAADATYEIGLTHYAEIVRCCWPTLLTQSSLN